MINKDKTAKNTDHSDELLEDIKNYQYTTNSKFEHDLYHDEDNIVSPLIRVKRVSLPDNGDKWCVYSNDQIVFSFDNKKLTKKESAFLRTMDGFNFIISIYKLNLTTSFNKFKMSLKTRLASNKKNIAA